MRSDRSDLCDWLDLPGGRRIAYTDTGPRDGLPVIYCHGAIGTPLQATVDLGRLTAQLGVRYIAPSRPGFGGSDPVRSRTILGFADDLGVLADALGLETFSVVGVSAGGPYALAAAHRLGSRVGRVAVCSSLAPLGPPHRAAGVPVHIRLALGVLGRAPGFCRRLGDAGLPLVALHPAARRTSFLDAAAGGVGGMIDDYLIYSTDWGFRPEAVAQEVHLWHGVRDVVVPVEHALQLAMALPSSRVFLDPEEGHHCFRSSLERILGVLVGARQAAARSSISGGRSTGGAAGGMIPSASGPRKAVGSGP